MRRTGVRLPAPAEVRSKIDHAEEDRIFSNDIAVAGDLIRTKKIVDTAHEAARKENIELGGTQTIPFTL